MTSEPGYRFFGRERVTIELDGTFTPGALVVPPGLVLELDREGRARVRLFAFHVEGLRIARVPFVRSSYAEVLWRVAVRAGESPAWWVVACDLGARAPRWLAARYVRYPVRTVAVDVDVDRVRCRGTAGGLAIALGPIGTTTAEIECRPLVVGDEGEWEVPFGDDAAPADVATATVEIDSLAEATLGAPVTWASTALIRQGREHRCGVAKQRR